MIWKAWPKTWPGSTPSGSARRPGAAGGAALNTPTHKEEGSGSRAVRLACHAACRWCAHALRVKLHPRSCGAASPARTHAHHGKRTRHPQGPHCAAHAKPAGRKPHNITGSYATARRTLRQDQRTAGGSHKPRYVQARVPRGVECTPRRPLKVATAPGPFFFPTAHRQGSTARRPLP